MYVNLVKEQTFSISFNFWVNEDKGSWACLFKHSLVNHVNLQEDLPFYDFYFGVR